MQDKDKFDKRVNEINNLIERSSKVELIEEKGKKSQSKIDKSAKNFLSVIKKARSVIVKSNKKEKNNDYSDIDKSNKQLTKYGSASKEFYGNVSQVAIDVEYDDRRGLLDDYDLSFNIAQAKVDVASTYRHSLTMKDSVSQKEIKELNKNIEDAEVELDKLVKKEVSEDDRDIKEYKETKLKEILSETTNSIKFLKANNVYRNNRITQKINILDGKVEKNIYYNIDVKPYLNVDENK